MSGPSVAGIGPGPRRSGPWKVRVGATTPEAAGVIHSDFERGFIRSEVYALDDLEAARSEAGLRAVGKQRVEGQEHVFNDGDVMRFRFNVYIPTHPCEGRA